MDPPDAAAADKNRLSLVEGEGTVFRDEGATAVEAEYRPRADVAFVVSPARSTLSEVAMTSTPTPRR